MAKPTGAVCNLDCAYCYYLSKERLYPGSDFRMSDEVLETYIRQLLEAQRHAPEVHVAFQGGEPTLMPLSFFQRAIEIARTHRQPGQKISFSLQTNGVRLDDAWCRLFAENGFLIGLSIDGPQDVHDAYRVNKGGRGTHGQVVRAWKMLQEARVEVNVLCTVHSMNQHRGLEVYRYFRDELGARFIQFIPIVERSQSEALSALEGPQPRPLYQQTGNTMSSRSVDPEAYGTFLCEIFDEWVRRDVGEVFVQMFDITLGAYFGLHSLCVFAPTCGDALALEHNGDVYACDHFVEPRFRLGNILVERLENLIALPQLERFGLDKKTLLPRKCRKCEFLFACNGGCPKDRFARTPDGEDGLNVLCPGLLKFFRHTSPLMRRMADLVQKGREASEVIELA